METAHRECLHVAWIDHFADRVGASDRRVKDIRSIGFGDRGRFSHIGTSVAIEVEVDVDTGESWFARIANPVTVDIEPFETGRTTRRSEGSKVGRGGAAERHCNGLRFLCGIRSEPTCGSHNADNLCTACRAKGVSSGCIGCSPRFPNIQDRVVVRVDEDLPAGDANFASVLAGVSVDIAVDSTSYRSADGSSRHAEGQHVGAVIDSTAEGNPSRRRVFVHAEIKRFVVTVAENSIATGTGNNGRVIELIHNPILKVVWVLVNTTQIMARFVGDNHRQKFSKQIRSRNVSSDGNHCRVHRVGDQDIDHHQAAFLVGEVPHVDRLCDP